MKKYFNPEKRVVSNLNDTNFTEQMLNSKKCKPCWKELSKIYLYKSKEYDYYTKGHKPYEDEKYLDGELFPSGVDTEAIITGINFDMDRPWLIYFDIVTIEGMKIKFEVNAEIWDWELLTIGTKINLNIWSNGVIVYDVFREDIFEKRLRKINGGPWYPQKVDIWGED